MNQSTQINSLLATVIAAAILVPTSEAFATSSRYLPDPTTGEPVFQYGQMMPTQFDRDVNSSIGRCGDIRFDYDTYSADPNGTVSGGAALSGGFFLDSSRCMELPGFQLSWVQTVAATQTGSNAITDWRLPSINAGEYPDATPIEPVYAEQSPAIVNPPFAAPTLGFQDFPERPFANGTQYWIAELGLVAITNNMIPMEMGGVTMMFREVRVLSTLLWGFSFNNPTAPFSVNRVTARAPYSWGTPTQSYLDTLNNFYDGEGGGDPNAMPPTSGEASTKYKFVSSNNINQTPFLAKKN